MRYLMMIKMDESMPLGPPPPALYEAIGELGEQATKDGTMLEQGGLAPSSAGALIRLSNGKISVLDGPFTEAKEVIGGYALFQLHSKEEAIEHARRFMQVHADNWPGVEAVVEVRQLMDFEPEA
ncbi:MAG: hypothetical protein QOK11_1391 [Pseudonocardiales bacterium]|jgi:hypothetical protein|nr:hypothetical protein [Pseudonocardiales bacterium]